MQDKVNAEFKLPIVNIFHTHDGVREFHAVGNLNLNQKDSFALGHLKREIGFESYHLAENLLTSSFFDIVRRIKSQTTSMSFDTDTFYTTTPRMAPSDTDSSVHITLEMNVPAQQKIRVDLPILEQFKLAWVQYISFFIIFATLTRLLYKLV